MDAWKGVDANVIEPTRILAARQVRGYSRGVVAEAINCSLSYYSEMESGRKKPDKYLALLSSKLNFPEPFFFDEELEMPTRDSFSYRRKSSMKAFDRNVVQSMGAIIGSNLNRLIKSYVKLPEVCVPDISMLTDIEEPLQFGESASQAIRSAFGMYNEPLGNALDLAETMGIRVFWVDGPDEFDGVSFWVFGNPYILLNRNMQDGYRVRFTVLHEILHICAHKSNPAPGKKEDKQADAFASAMLMPVASFKPTAPRHFNPYGLLENRRIWGASARAQVRRAHDLSILSDWAYRDAFIKMNRMWGRTEPAPRQPETSTVHTFFFEEAGDRGKFAFDLAEESLFPYDLFLNAFPTAASYEKSQMVTALP